MHLVGILTALFYFYLYIFPGISVPGVTLTTKSVKLRGMNGLKGGVIINSFDLPSNDPAGGVHLTLQTTVTNVHPSFISSK